MMDVPALAGSPVRIAIEVPLLTPVPATQCNAEGLNATIAGPAEVVATRPADKNAAASKPEENFIGTFLESKIGLSRQRARSLRCACHLVARFTGRPGRRCGSARVDSALASG